MPSPSHPQPAVSRAQCASRAPRDGQAHEFPGRLAFASILFALICTSCGAVASGPPPPPPPTPPSLSVSPDSAQLFVGTSRQFSAQVQNAAGAAVTWQVNQTPNGNSTFGTITANGEYTAPSQVPNNPTVTVTAVLQADSSVSGSASVAIQSLSAFQGSLAVSPSLASVTTSQPLQLNAQIPGGTVNGAVRWAVACVPAGACVAGTITQTGLFTPPNEAGANTVTVSLLANPDVTGAATVEVTDFPGTLTWRNDNSRSGVNSRELALAPSTVNSSEFGWLFRCPLDGYAYAQPLYVPNLLIGGVFHNVVFVATENDSVFAFDADAEPCEQLWMQSLVTPGVTEPIAFPNLIVSGTDIVPFVGITGTPAVDASASLLYVVAATQTIPTESNLNPTFSQKLFALDLATGTPSILPNGIVIALPAPQLFLFDPGIENQRPALLLAGRTVYVGFGSYGGQCVGGGDGCLYHGLLLGYDSSTLQQTGVFDVTPSASVGEGGIWQSGGGPSADDLGSVFVITGDGPYGPGQDGTNYSDSFLRLTAAQASGALSVADSFTPCNQAALQVAGLDVGASAPVLLPPSAGSPTGPDLLIGGSKEGWLYVVNREDMGGYQPSPCPGSDSPPRVQTISLSGPVLSTPLYWNGELYVAPGNGNLTAYPLSSGTLSAAPSATQTQETLGPQGATPAISANGTNNAILWLIDTSGALSIPNGPAVLRAYDPNNNLNEIYNSAMAADSRDQAGAAVKFTVPTVANGKVYVGTQTELDVYGLL